jgi:hypothetical protein
MLAPVYLKRLYAPELNFPEKGIKARPGDAPARGTQALVQEGWVSTVVRLYHINRQE